MAGDVHADEGEDNGEDKDHEYNDFEDDETEEYDHHTNKPEGLTYNIFKAIALLIIGFVIYKIINS